MTAPSRAAGLAAVVAMAAGAASEEDRRGPCAVCGDGFHDPAVPCPLPPSELVGFEVIEAES